MTIIEKSKSKNGNEKLSDNFLLGEYACPESDRVLINMELVLKLEQLKTKLGAKSCIIISGYRSPAYSVKVGGYATDQHTKGNAADVRFKRTDSTIISGKTVCCAAQDLGFNGIAYMSETSTHLDVRSGSKYYGDERKGNNTVTNDFYTYFGIMKSVPVSHYPPTPYRGDSITAGLNQVNVDSSYSNRTRIAFKNGIANYIGTAAQNLVMLKLLQEGKLIK